MLNKMNFLSKKVFRIILVNSPNYCGGTLVITTLCKTLRSIGYDARIFYLPGFPRRNTCKIFWYRIIHSQITFLLHCYLYRFFCFGKNFSLQEKDSITKMMVAGCKYQWNPLFSRKKTIVVYPEVQYGNPLKSYNVVRWLLYFYQYKNDLNAYSPKDKFIAYRKIYNDIDLNPDNDTLRILSFNKDLYYQYNFGKREGNCYILRKGKNRKDLPQSFDGPVYDDNMTQEDLVALFNRCKYCYSYDTQTFYCKIAAVCGCIPIVLLEPGKTEKDYLTSEEKHYGVAYGNTSEQIEFAIKTRHILLKDLDYSDRNVIESKKFIDYLERNFGKIRKIKL